MSSMASTPIKICWRSLLFLGLFVLFTTSTAVTNIPLASVSDLLIQSALDSLNEHSPTHHTYKSGNLISAQKLVDAPYMIYRLTLNLEANCNEATSCPREACAIDLRQHEEGVIEVEKSSIQCMYLHPQSAQDEMQQQHVLENVSEKTESVQRDAVTVTTTERMLQLDHEVETVMKNDSERPFIAVRATDRNYCAGCPYELNPALPGLAAFGEQVVRKMDDEGRSDFKHKVVSIVRVTRAVPPGSNVVKYEINLEIGETNCPRSTAIERSECTFLPNIPIKSCFVTFEERPWQENSRIITSNNCTDLPDADNELNVSYEQHQQPLTITESLTTSSAWRAQQSANFPSSLRDFHEVTTPSAITEDTFNKVVISTENVEDQRITGFTDKIKEFDAFLEDFDIPIKNPTPEPENHRLPVNEETIRPQVIQRTSAPIFQNDEGDSSATIDQQTDIRTRRALVDTPDDENELVRKLAQRAIDLLDDIDVDNNKRIVLGVTESKKEDIHDGKIYHVTIKVAPTKCDELENNQHKSIAECLEGVREPTKICKVQIHLDNKGSLESAKVLQLQCYPEDTYRNSASRVRRQEIPGGTWKKDIDDPEIRNYAKKGLQKFSEISDSENEPFLVDILEATAQVVSGMLYKIKVRLGESTCPKGTQENCLLRENSDVNDYLITVWSQPWLDKGNPDIKVELQRKNNDNQVERVRRSGRRLGGPTEKDPNDPTIREYVDKGLRKFSKTSDSENEPFLVDILEATAQVVSGMLYKIKVRLGESTCRKGTKENCLLKENSDVNDYLITVWSQPWLDKGNPDIKVELQRKNNDNHVNRVRRSDRILGAPAEKDPNDPTIKEYVDKGLRKFSKTSDSENEPFLVDILEATAQVVSGMLYKIKVRLGESTCPKGSKENCQLKQESDVNDYLITVWSQPWMDNGNPKINIERHGHERRQRRETPKNVGESSLISADDPQIQAYAQRGVGLFSSRFDGPYEHLLVEITQASEQIVAGKLYKIKVKLGESDCPKGSNKEICRLKPNGEIKNCIMTVWSQPWIDNGNPDVNVECTNSNNSPLNRKKKSLRGVNYNAKMLNLAQDIKQEKDFQDFITKYEKVYTTEEEKKVRFEIFKKNMKLVEKLRENERGTAIYGASIFADIAPEEFRSKYLGYKPQLRSENQIPFPQARIPDIKLPKEFDWRHYNVVTEVKNQQACGSCWAFSVTGNVEGLYAIKTGRLLSLSEQELVDCDNLDEGCEGGLPDNAYRAIETLGGLELESDYPYDGRDEKCHFDKSKATVKVLSGLNITTDETGMAKWLVKNGPISIGINANAMQFYMGGISHPWKFLCDSKNLDHGVLIVGYGVHTYPIFKKTMPYWIVKNSWGPRWGEQGYYRVYRGDGTCGLNTMATSAVLG